MSSKLEALVLDEKGIQALLKSPEMASIMNAHLSRIQNAAGAEYEATLVTGAKRLQGRVECASAHAFYSNRKHNTLLKALKG